MDELDAETKFAAMAKVYDSHILMTIPRYEDFFAQTLSLVRAVVPHPDRWLDTGTGTGTMVDKALNAFADTEFYLEDPSKHMLGQARNKLDLPSNPRVHIAEQPATTPQLKYADASFDVITAIQCHHYMDIDDRQAALANCYRCLKPGGILVVFENIRPFTEVGIKIGLHRWQAFQVAAGKTEEDANQHAQRFEREYFPITVEQHLSMLRGLGMAAVEILWLSYLQAGFYAIK